MPPVEGGAIYNCVLCDSYSVVTLGVLPDRKHARGLKAGAYTRPLFSST